MDPQDLCADCCLHDECFIGRCQRIAANPIAIRPLWVIGVPAKQSLYLNGGPTAAGLYLLCRGQIILTRRHPKICRDRIISIVRPPTLLGEEGLFADRYFGSALAQEDSRVIFISKMQFKEAIVLHHELALWLLGELSRACKAWREKVMCSQSSQLDEGFLLETLKDLSDSQGHVELSQTELAHLFGVSRPTMNKHLQKLKHQGLIQLARKSITLLGEPLESCL